MLVHDRSRSDQDERLPPPRPERSQGNPKQFVQGSQSMVRSLRMQSQQLLTESQVFKDEVLTETESADHPAEEMSERRDHSRNHIGKARIEVCAKSFILQVYEVLARHNMEVWRLFSLRRACSPRTVPDVENVHNAVAFIHGVHNSVPAWLSPKKQMAKFLTFWNDCPTLGKSL